MKEYQDIIDTYSLKGYEMYARTTDPNDWRNKEIGVSYLSRFWLDSFEFEQKWK